MTSIIVAFPVADDANRIKSILVRNGYEDVYSCVSAAQVISMCADFDDGIVICGYKLSDMIYSDLYNILPDGFSMLLLASQAKLDMVNKDSIICVAMPLHIQELIHEINALFEIRRREKRKHAYKRERTDEQKKTIEEAKQLLMSNRNMSEDEAHRYIQKISMDSGNSMVETADMVIRLFG